MRRRAHMSRIFKLAKKWTSFRVLLKAIVHTVLSMGSFSVLLSWRRRRAAAWPAHGASVDRQDGGLRRRGEVSPQPLCISGAHRVVMNEEAVTQHQGIRGRDLKVTQIGIHKAKIGNRLVHANRFWVK